MKYIIYECDKCHVKTDLNNIVRCSIPRIVEFKIDNNLYKEVKVRSTDLCKKCAKDIALDFKVLDETEDK